MKINDSLNLSNIKEEVHNHEFSKKNFNELSGGEMFKATIKDIHPNSVTLVLENGNTINAKSLVLPDTRIGEEAIFLVKENFKGQILLEMVKADAENPSILREALDNADMIFTKENAELVNSLIKNNLPIDPQTLQKAAFFKYFGEGMEIDKIIFLLEEDFPAEANTVKNITNLFNGTLNIDTNINKLIDQILEHSLPESKFELLDSLITTEELIEKLGVSGSSENIDNINLKEFLSHDFDIFNKIDFSKIDLSKINNNDGFNVENLKNNIFKEMLNQKFFLDPKNTNISPNEYFNDLNKIICVLGEIENKNDVKNVELLNNIENIKDNLEFTNKISNFKEYMNIPFNINNTTNQGELHIFKNRKGDKDFKRNASILLSLDYANLGHIDVFVNKLNENLSIQLKSDNNKTLKSLAKNSNKLMNSLSEKGYFVSQFTIKKLDKKFNINDKMRYNEQKKSSSKRYSFDMRV